MDHFTVQAVDIDHIALPNFKRDPLFHEEEEDQPILRRSRSRGNSAASSATAPSQSGPDLRKSRSRGNSESTQQQQEAMEDLKELQQFKHKWMTYDPEKQKNELA